MSALDIPADIQASDISSNLNSVVLLIFLMGIYTTIYFGTIYVYLTKNPSKYLPVPAAITILYLSSIAESGCQWYTTKWQFVDNGNTQQSVFLAGLDIPQWMNIVFNVSQYVVFVIADGLLIWRCFYVWGRSFRIISMPLLLIVAEIALYFVFISFDVKYSDSALSQALAISLNDMLAAAFFISFGTTLITTVLIAYKIHFVLKRNGASSRRYKHIIDIVVQSGALYAFSQLAAAIAGVVPSSNPFDKRVVSFQDYAETLNFATAGISTTVMVARVALYSTDTTFPSTSMHLSGLQFRTHSTHPAVNMEAMEITHSAAGEIISADEGKAPEDKV